MTAISTPSRSWTILRHRLRGDVVGLPVIWALFALAVAVVIALVAIFLVDIEISGWEQASQITRWYVGATGVYFTAVYLPLYVTHGITRQEFAAQLPLLVGAFAGTYALLMAAGFGIEAVVYGWLDWPHELVRGHLFETPTQSPIVFLEFLLVGAVWTVGGTIMGAAFYRNGFIGTLLIPVALAMVGLAEAVTGPGYLGPIGGVVDALSWLAGLSGSIIRAILVCAALVAGGLGITWTLIRDLPVRTPTS